MKPGTQYYGNVNVIWISQDYNNPKQDQNWIDKQLDQQIETELATRFMEQWDVRIFGWTFSPIFLIIQLIRFLWYTELKKL